MGGMVGTVVFRRHGASVHVNVAIASIAEEGHAKNVHPILRQLLQRADLPK